ncbi:SUKH-3 domain-containing protein [Micromonospora sp. NPDC049580]|uniref:SUKH-3 domain-containing protein n=1 Tax=unclassified Micromonospora TaxID=2617518 RepID=UPI00341B89AF
MRGDDRPLPDRAAQILGMAGWTPRRRVDVGERKQGLAPEGFAMHAPARAFLTEFRGLVVLVSGPGRDSARIGVRLAVTAHLAGGGPRTAQLISRAAPPAYPAVPFREWNG